MRGILRSGWLALVIVCCLTFAVNASENSPFVRVKDIARVQGVRDNQLYGLGLVVGLNGTGDSNSVIANSQMTANMMELFGITVSAEDLRLRNVAVVMVTADINTSVRVGDRINVSVSSIGDARSLQGGFLLQTPLQAADGQIYAAAQGAVSIGGFVVRGGSSSVQQNHPTVGMVPNGAIVEQEIPQLISDGNELAFVLAEPDFSTANRLAETINQVYDARIAIAQDQATVKIAIPEEYQDNQIAFIASIEELPIRPDSKARVIINERTGTVVMGSGVRISPVAVAHGNLHVQVGASLEVSQPPALSAGQTVLGYNYSVAAVEDKEQLVLVDGTTSIEELIAALNAIGASPRDIIAILQAIKAAGALYGELVIM